MILRGGRSRASARDRRHQGRRGAAFVRAVDPQALKELAAAAPRDAPIHIHAAEQTREVEECITALGKRPVEWLLSEMRLDERWCVVHATHMTPEETEALARSGAVAGLCPTTEGSLGDGVFPLVAYRAASGRYGIGGDSHVSRDPAEELRLLEYFQRVSARKRNLVTLEKVPAVGTALWLEAAAAGRRSGAAWARLPPACAPTWSRWRRANWTWRGWTPTRLPTRWRSPGARGPVRDAMVAGERMLRERRHRQGRGGGGGRQAGRSGELRR